jgi:hypothetical protein
MFKKWLEHCSYQCITVNVVHGNGEPDVNTMLSPQAFTASGSEIMAHFCLAHPTRRNPGKTQPLALLRQSGGGPYHPH